MRSRCIGGHFLRNSSEPQRWILAAFENCPDFSNFFLQVFSSDSDAQSETHFFFREEENEKFFWDRLELHALLLLGLASSSRCAVTDPYGTFTVKSFAPKSSVPFRAIRP
ncbi:hypothetical protein C2845_PM14G15630 [Panicum miliaceum]|uniref:Uncharacterized protein n=1 Tax=Panicum miliaceum TaxID=4540 RepID=A0A3L6PM16_PANMI|nr:hypothetical protein C2845_PM14G15630 [Panicum miliaceum]